MYPATSNTEFLSATKDVLEMHRQGFEDQEVLVCLEEGSKLLVQGPASP